MTMPAPIAERLTTLARLAAAPPKSGPLTFTASSTALNRHGFSLRTDGWRLDNYNANPVVLWMHDAWSPPIGRAAVRNAGDRIVAEVTFDQSDEFARSIEAKYRGGFMSAVSVGLDFVDADGAPLDVWRLTPEKIRDEAFYDMAELSAVTVPSDPGALIENALARPSSRSYGRTAPPSTRRAPAAPLGRRSAPYGRTAATVDAAAARKVLDAFEPTPAGAAGEAKALLAEVESRSRAVDRALGDMFAEAFARYFANETKETSS
jgi:hypothetical protein